MQARDVATVIAVADDSIVHIHGLANTRYGEILELPQDTFGMSLNLEQDSVGSVVPGDYEHRSKGDRYLDNYHLRASLSLANSIPPGINE